MATFRQVDATAISADGKFVAYSVATARMSAEGADYLTHIWVASSDGRRNQQFTHGKTSCTAASFSPDGKYLSFLSARGSTRGPQIWLAPMTGGEARQLSNAEQGVTAYAWAPDSRMIAFTALDPVPANGERKDHGRVIDAAPQYAHLYTVAAQQNSFGVHPVARLTGGAFHIAAPFDGAGAFDWAPDGQAIVFAHRENAAVDAWPGTDISTVGIDDQKVQVLVDLPGADFSPRYSRDGKSVAFVSDGGEPRWAAANDIYLVPASGGETTKLSATADQNPQIIGWSENNKHIFFREADGTAQRFFSLPINGEPAVVITHGAGTYTKPSLSAKGDKFALVHETAEILPNVYVTSTQTPSLKKITNLNRDYPNLRMGKTEVISWTAQDGQEIQGLLTYPVYHQIDRSAPLIVLLHDGPNLASTQTYTASGDRYPIQAFAQQGYAVLRPNPRGSTGYGKEYRFANYAGWGMVDADDVLAGVNKVVGMNVAHPDSLCVLGWGYGGYLAAFITTRSRRFRAAAVGAAPSNLVSLAGTTSRPSYLSDYLGGSLWQNFDTYVRHSPVFNVAGARTPTQILHGENDQLVPPGQAFELYHALKNQKVATELILYPAGHTATAPGTIIDIGERTLAWFNHQLGRAPRTGVITLK